MRRAHRLRRPADFQRVRAMRRSWGHPLLVLYVAPNDGPTTRLGISVGKRVGKAVVRNGVKRRVREAVRHRLQEILPGHDLVFIARAPAAEASWPALRDATDDLLRRARMLRRAPAPGHEPGVVSSAASAGAELPAAIAQQVPQRD
jgi:ribonuclease P protein component